MKKVNFEGSMINVYKRYIKFRLTDGYLNLHCIKGTHEVANIKESYFIAIGCSQPEVRFEKIS